MKKIKLNIIKDRVLRIRFIRSEIFYKITKSVLQNNNVINLKKNYFFFLLKKICLNKKTQTKKKTHV